MANKKNPQITIKQWLKDDALEVAEIAGLDSAADALAMLMRLYKQDLVKRLTGNYSPSRNLQQSTTDLQQSTASPSKPVEQPETVDFLQAFENA